MSQSNRNVDVEVEDTTCSTYFRACAHCSSDIWCNVLRKKIRAHHSRVDCVLHTHTHKKVQNNAKESIKRII